MEEKQYREADKYHPKFCPVRCNEILRRIIIEKLTENFPKKLKGEKKVKIVAAVIWFRGKKNSDTEKKLSQYVKHPFINIPEWKITKPYMTKEDIISLADNLEIPFSRYNRENLPLYGKQKKGLFVFPFHRQSSLQPKKELPKRKPFFKIEVPEQPNNQGC